MVKITYNDLMSNPNMLVFNHYGDIMKLTLIYNDILGKHLIYHYVKDLKAYVEVVYLPDEELWVINEGTNVKKLKLFTDNGNIHNSKIISEYDFYCQTILNNFIFKHNINLIDVDHHWVNGVIGGTYDFVYYTLGFTDMVMDLRLNLPVEIYNKYCDDIWLGLTTDSYFDWYQQFSSK